MTDPSNREAQKQEAEARFGKLKAGIPKHVFDLLPWEEKLIVRWFDLKIQLESNLPHDYFRACLEVARRLEDTTVWLPGPNVVVRTKARQG